MFARDLFLSLILSLFSSSSQTLVWGHIVYDVGVIRSCCCRWRRNLGCVEANYVCNICLIYVRIKYLFVV